MGFTPSYLRDAGRGLATVEQVTTFTRELLAGDVIEVRSEVAEVREKVIRIVHRMYRVETGELAATCAITGVHIDLAARRSCEIPEAIRAFAQGFVRLPAAA
jgi:acyl-CoA thioester hydrolase